MNRCGLDLKYKPYNELNERQKKMVEEWCKEIYTALRDDFQVEYCLSHSFNEFFSSKRDKQRYFFYISKYGEEVFDTMEEKYFK